ncbi:HEAT repeat domain-containing protein [Catenulispora rubra]|uniref:HEAT repeat domain-containing protein n=1 Tax=Catenulispora rubra TaxID=280293 RepID=UPI0018922CFB|nr:HEAT repeat domain-containing protein [Catenulispora rubra]
MIAAIEAVDWPTLAHAYGPATDTAGYLRAALAGDSDAVSKLGMSLYHQGGCVYSAGAAAVPILIDMACESAVVHRRRVLGILTKFARLLRDINEPWRTYAAALELRATMRIALPRFIELLDDADPGVRRMAAGLVAVYDSDADQIAEALRRRFQIETDYPVRVTLLLCLGELSAELSADVRPGLATWAVEASETDGRARLAGLIARHRLTPDSAVDADAVFAALADPALVANDYFVKAESAGGLVRWLVRYIDDGGFQLRLATWGLRNEEIRASGAPVFRQVGGVLLRSRVAASALLPDIAQLLDRQQAAETRTAAAHLLAAAGQSAQPYADLLLDVAHDPDDAVATRGIWALAHLGDPRVIPDLVEAIDGAPARFAFSENHYQADTLGFMLTDVPGLADVLTPMRPHADALIPALRRRLARETTTPGLYHLTEVLAAYGPAAAAALPELRALLAGADVRLACNVLGNLGPDAAEAAEELHGIGASSHQDAATAAWAYLRITGDPELFLRGADVDPDLIRSAPQFRQAADLGPHGTELAERFATILNAKRSYWQSWPGVEAAHAHWRITSDPTLCLDVFDAALDPLRHGRLLPISRQALRYLPELGSAAAAFRPLLEQTMASQERLLYSGGWRGIAEDEEVVSLARAAIAAM